MPNTRALCSAANAPPSASPALDPAATTTIPPSTDHSATAAARALRAHAARAPPLPRRRRRWPTFLPKCSRAWWRCCRRSKTSGAPGV
eukprot:93354-Prymnesium_polylepis.1